MRLCSIFVLSVFIARPVYADSWRMTLGDFRTDVVTLKGIDAAGITVESGGAVRTIAMTDFVEIRQVNQNDVASASPFILELAGGERVAGEPVGIVEEQIVWRNAIVGEVKIPIASARAIVRKGAAMITGDAPTEDQVRLVNGDVISGIINTLDQSAVNVQSQGNAVPVPLNTISSVRFAIAAGGTDGTARSAAFRLRLTDGSVLRANAITVRQSTLQVSGGGSASRDIPITMVNAIEQIAGPVAWLSSIAPIESIQTPHLGATRPARMNLSITGDPIRSADGSTVRGIGVASKSKVSWTLDGTYRFFRTRYGIAGDLPYADVTVRVLLDGKVVHEQTHLKSATPKLPITVDLASAKMLTLEVDYGDTFDVQDHLNWIEPALSRVAPTTQP